MTDTPLVRLALALLALLFAGAAAAECRSVDDPASACRYPRGDAWCARHGNGAPYAYRDECGQADARTGTGAEATTRAPAATGAWTPAIAWDCAKARTAVERLICAHPDIRAQDDRMGALYARLQARGQAPVEEQKRWLMERRAACGDADCLRAVYAERIRALDRQVDSAGSPARAPAPETVPAPPRPAPRADARASEPSAQSGGEPGPESVPEPAPDPAWYPVADPADEGSATGIPELPPPEGPTWHPTPGASGFGSSPPPEVGTPLAGGSGRVWASLAGLGVGGLGLGWLAWRRRGRMRAAVAPARRSAAAPGRRTGAVPRAAPAAPSDPSAGGLAAERRVSRAPSAPAASPPVPGHTGPGLRLPEEVLARLRALAGPGESLASVVARAVTALEAAAERGTADPVLSRLAALEARLAQVEKPAREDSRSP